MDELGSAQKYCMGPLVLGCGTTEKPKNVFLERLAKLNGDDGPRLFVQMCVLAGCDYLESMKNIGLLSASKLVLKFRLVSADNRIRAIVKDLNKQRPTDRVPDEYISRAMQAGACHE